MKTFRKYYVVDEIAENVIGTFEAISDDMAKVMFKKSILDNEKLKDFVEQYALYRDSETFSVCETFGEIVDSSSKTEFLGIGGKCQSK